MLLCRCKVPLTVNLGVRGCLHSAAVEEVLLGVAHTKAHLHVILTHNNYRFGMPVLVGCARQHVVHGLTSEDYSQR